jgi:hypothetical protein
VEWKITHHITAVWDVNHLQKTAGWHSFFLGLEVLRESRTAVLAGAADGPLRLHCGHQVALPRTAAGTHLQTFAAQQSKSCFAGFALLGGERSRLKEFCVDRWAEPLLESR